MTTSRAPRRGSLRALVAVLAAAGCAALPARADELPPPRSLSRAPMGAGAYPAGPFVPLDAGLRLDGRADVQVASDPRVSGPCRVDTCAPITGTPYRVEPRDCGRISSPWDIPPEVPDPRDFERVDTLDQLMNPQRELREEIWAVPEDFISPFGYARYGGIAYVPFWARNTIRYGRLALFPWVHAEAIWHSNFQSTGSDGDGTFEALFSAGVMAEYVLEPGRTKVKAEARGDYHWYDSDLSDAATYVVGASLEHRFTKAHTMIVGAEMEESRVASERNFALFDDDALVQRWGAFGGFTWDYFLNCDLKLDLGVSYDHTDEVGGDEHGGDHDDLAIWGRLGWAIMRHESFLYGEYRYETRTAEGDSSDLTDAHELRIGVDGIMPQARTRRLVGNAYVGYRIEQYEAADTAGSLGAGHDDDVSTITAGVDWTYRPSPYTSAWLSFTHGNAFSARANYNMVDTLTLAVSQNLSNKVVGRLASSWTRVEPQDESASNRLTVGAGVRWAVYDSLDITGDVEYSHRFEGAGLPESDTVRVAVGATLQIR
jgi:hypothetical protein